MKDPLCVLHAPQVLLCPHNSLTSVIMAASAYRTVMATGAGELFPSDEGHVWSLCAHEGLCGSGSACSAAASPPSPSPSRQRISFPWLKLLAASLALVAACIGDMGGGEGSVVHWGSLVAGLWAPKEGAVAGIQWRWALTFDRHTPSEKGHIVGSRRAWYEEGMGARQRLLWPNNTMHVFIDTAPTQAGRVFDEKELEAIRAALAKLSLKTNLQAVELKAESPTTGRPHHYVTIKPDDRPCHCLSARGRVPFLQLQRVWLGRGCGVEAMVLHELLHRFGVPFKVAHLMLGSAYAGIQSISPGLIQVWGRAAFEKYGL